VVGWQEGGDGGDGHRGGRGGLGRMVLTGMVGEGRGGYCGDAHRAGRGDGATRGWGADPAGMTVTTVMGLILLMAGRTGLVGGRGGGARSVRMA
jgi:hypothetical protein